MTEPDVQAAREAVTVLVNDLIEWAAVPRSPRPRPPLNAALDAYEAASRQAGAAAAIAELVAALEAGLRWEEFVQAEGDPPDAHPFLFDSITRDEATAWRKNAERLLASVKEKAQ